jgi:hypothetical protein
LAWVRELEQDAERLEILGHDNEFPVDGSPDRNPPAHGQVGGLVIGEIHNQGSRHLGQNSGKVQFVGVTAIVETFVLNTWRAINGPGQGKNAHEDGRAQAQQLVPDLHVSGV